VQRPEPSEGACGEQKRRSSRFEGVARSLRQNERPVELRSGSDPTTIRSSRRKTPRSRAVSTNPSRGRSFAPDLRPLCLVDRVPIRLLVRGSRCDRRSVEPGDKRCPGVFEPGLRSPPPHRWRATPRLIGLSGRCACIRSGSLRQRSTPIALELATAEGLFPSFEWGLASTRCERTSSARRQVDRQQDRLVAKTRGASPREATSCRDLESEPQGTLARVKNGCRARNARPLQGSRASRAKVSSAEETRTFHEVRCANRSWSTANEPSELREGRSKSTTGTRGGG